MEESVIESQPLYDDSLFNLLEVGEEQQEQIDQLGLKALAEALNYDRDIDFKDGLIEDLTTNINFDVSDWVSLTTPSSNTNDQSLPSCDSTLSPADVYASAASTSECSIAVSEDNPLSDESADVVTVIVSPDGEITSPPMKKRGRKPKGETGEKAPPRKRKRKPRPKKIKIYQIDTPLNDEVCERKRINAVNAKKYRDQQKMAKESLQQKLHDLTIEKESLQREAEVLRKNTARLEKQVEAFKRTVAPLVAMVDVGP